MDRPHHRGLALFSVLLSMAAMAVSSAAEDRDAGIRAWTRWQDISRAIELRPLDDPSDIIEKAEIIEDRSDKLEKEKRRLEQWSESHKRNDQMLREQRRLLQEVAELNQGGDFQSRQRILDLTERIQQASTQLTEIKKSLADLQAEINRLRALDAEYRRKAQQLRTREIPSP